MKSEPTTFSFDNLLAAANQTTHWDGVRNFAASNFMRNGMKLGDPVFLTVTCGNVGLEALFNDDLDRAQDAFDEEEEGDAVGEGYCLARRGRGHAYSVSRIRTPAKLFPRAAREQHQPVNFSFTKYM